MAPPSMDRSPSGRSSSSSSSAASEGDGPARGPTGLELLLELADRLAVVDVEVAARLGEIVRLCSPWPVRKVGEVVAVGELRVEIETPRGSVRRWKDKNGTEGQTIMALDYGFIQGTCGADGEEIDCFLGPDVESTWVFVVHQNVSFAYDEDKVVLCCGDANKAKELYLLHYTDTSFFGSMSLYQLSEFTEILAAKYRGALPVTKSLNGPRIVMRTAVVEKASGALSIDRVVPDQPRSGAAGFDLEAGIARPVHLGTSFDLQDVAESEVGISAHVERVSEGLDSVDGVLGRRMSPPNSREKLLGFESIRNRAWRVLKPVMVFGETGSLVVPGGGVDVEVNAPRKEAMLQQQEKRETIAESTRRSYVDFVGAHDVADVAGVKP